MSIELGEIGCLASWARGEQLGDDILLDQHHGVLFRGDEEGPQRRGTSEHPLAVEVITLFIQHQNEVCVTTHSLACTSGRDCDLYVAIYLCPFLTSLFF
jgi:hypothetical protein